MLAMMNTLIRTIWVILILVAVGPEDTQAQVKTAEAGAPDRTRLIEGVREDRGAGCAGVAGGVRSDGDCGRDRQVGWRQRRRRGRDGAPRPRAASSRSRTTVTSGASTSMSRTPASFF